MQTQKPSRRIAEPELNEFVANGVDMHRATSIAPRSFFEPFSPSIEAELLVRQRTVEAQLRELLGKPSFAGPGFILYHHDCLDGLKRIAKSDLAFSVTVTSPPYNIGKEYEDITPVDEYIDWCATWMNSIHSITADNGAFWLNVGYLKVDHRGLCVPIPYLLWDKPPFYFLQEIVWNYGAGIATRNRLCPRNEKWLFYVKDPENYVFNLDDIRDPNVKYPNQKKNGRFRCNPLGKNPSDVWVFPKVTTGSKRSSKERTGHPAQFPLPVVERVIKASSNQLDLVLDPFAGSGSAGLAAAALGRIFVGFEVREDYCVMACRRFQSFWDQRSAALAQSTLF